MDLKIDKISLCCEKLSIELDFLSQLLYKTKNQQLKFKGYKYSQEVKKKLITLLFFLESEESFEFLINSALLEGLDALLSDIQEVVEKAGLCYTQMISQNYFVSQAIVQLACFSRINYLCKSWKNLMGE